MNKSNTRPLQAWEINAEWDCLCGVCGVDLGGECSGGCDGEDRKCVCGKCGDKGYDSDDEEENGICSSCCKNHHKDEECWNKCQDCDKKCVGEDNWRFCPSCSYCYCLNCDKKNDNVGDGQTCIRCEVSNQSSNQSSNQLCDVEAEIMKSIEEQGYTHYKCRAELFDDVISALVIIGKYNRDKEGDDIICVMSPTIKGSPMGDADFDFWTKTPIKTIQTLLDTKGKDLHRIIKTIKPIDKYDGKSDSSFWKKC